MFRGITWGNRMYKLSQRILKKKKSNYHFLFAGYINKNWQFLPSCKLQVCKIGREMKTNLEDIISFSGDSFFF